MLFHSIYFKTLKPSHHVVGQPSTLRWFFDGYSLFLSFPFSSLLANDWGRWELAKVFLVSSLFLTFKKLLQRPCTYPSEIISEALTTLLLFYNMAGFFPVKNHWSFGWLITLQAHPFNKNLLSIYYVPGLIHISTMFHAAGFSGILLLLFF